MTVTAVWESASMMPLPTDGLWTLCSIVMVTKKVSMSFGLRVVLSADPFFVMPAMRGRGG